MDPELLKLLDAFYAARSAVRDYVQRAENLARMHDIEEAKVLNLANLAVDELNEQFPEPEPEHEEDFNGLDLPKKGKK
jgi:hypothetical protein